MVRFPQVTASGLILFTDGGEIAGECCCGDTPVPCPGDCTACTHSYTLTISGLTGLCAGLNGVFPLIRNGCTWSNGFWGVACNMENWYVLPFPCAGTFDGPIIGSDVCPPYPESGVGTICAAYPACSGQGYSWSLT